MTLDPQQTATIDIASGMAETRDDRVGPRRKIPGSASGGSRFRPGVDAQLGDAAADQCHRIRCAALCAPRQFRHLRQCLAARGGERPAQEPARAVRAVELRDLRRSADRSAADRRLGKHRSRAPAGAGARVLALEGIGGRPRDLERGPRRISAGPSGSDHGADRRRRRSARDGPTGRDLRAAGRADLRTRTASCSSPWRAPSSPTAGGVWWNRSPVAARWKLRIPRLVPTRNHRGETAARGAARARIDPVQRPWRIHARRQRVRDHDTRGPGNARAVGQCAGESEFRDGDLRERTRVYVERERS